MRQPQHGVLCRMVAASGLWLAAFDPGNAAKVPVAVATFDYTDTSGEPQDETAAHAARLQAFAKDIQERLTASGLFQATAFQCAQPPCSAASLDQNDILQAAKAQHVRFLVFGGVHKTSTLIQWGQVEVMDVQNGKSALSRTVSFRGDSDDAWQHAGNYIGEMLVDQLR